METIPLLFLNMGPMEILVVVFFILMFFGSESIPKIARGLGRGVRQVKDAANEIKQEIRDSANDIHKEVEKGEKSFSENTRIEDNE